MKKLLILIIILVSMGCEPCSGVIGPDGMPWGCEQSEGQTSCGWGKSWDECTCECEWDLF